MTLPPATFQVMVERAVDSICLLDDKGHVLYMSPSFELLYGHPTASLVGNSVFDLLHPDDRALALLGFSRVMADEDQDEIVLRLRHLDGSWRFVEVMGRYDASLGEQTVIINIRDITQRQVLIEQIRRSEELFRAAFNATGAICTISLLDTGEFVDVNEAWVKATGWQREEAIGRTAIDLNIWGSEENRNRVVSVLNKQGRLRQFPARISRKDGGYRSLLVDAETIHTGEQPRMFISAMDITERELMEQQLRQSQRMEAVGQLTGGIAHDFNNMLTVILGQVDIALGSEDMTGTTRETLAAIRQAAERGAALIRQLMAFARRQILRPQIVDVARTISDLQPLIAGSLGSAIEVAVEAENVDWNCEIDPGLLENAVLNLVFNARDAMPSGGKLVLRLTQMELDRRAAARFELEPGRYLELKVIDNGTGMDESVANHAFEPFFTTKPSAQGTGLGLSMVFGFVTQSGGRIRIASTSGEGTTVTLLLPATDKPAAILERQDATTGNISQRVILLIEDDDALRAMLKTMLESMGCTVIHSDGQDLDEVLENQPKPDLLLTDVVLKGPLHGPQVAQRVSTVYPDLAVLFMSGYARDRLTSKEMLEQSAELLRKPFTRRELANRVSRLLR